MNKIILFQAKRRRRHAVGVALVAALVGAAGLAGNGAFAVTTTPGVSLGASVSVGRMPLGMALSPDGSTIYTANSFDSTVSVVDVATAKVRATIAVGNYPQSVAFNPNGAEAYVTNYGDGTVSVLDVASSLVSATISLGGYPFGVAFSPDGSKAFVTDEGTKGAI